jgi:hypothetical protein
MRLGGRLEGVPPISRTEIPARTSATFAAARIAVNGAYQVFAKCPTTLGKHLAARGFAADSRLGDLPESGAARLF